MTIPRLYFQFLYHLLLVIAMLKVAIFFYIALDEFNDNRFENEKSKYNIPWTYGELNRRDKKFARRCICYCIANNQNPQILYEIPIEILQEYWDNYYEIFIIGIDKGNFLREKRLKVRQKIQNRNKFPQPIIICE